MCGRFTSRKPSSALAGGANASVREEVRGSFNVAPGKRMAAVVLEEGRRVLVAFQWGLVPSWAKDPSIGDKLINARAETVHEKPAFRSALKHRRCLILADGFYEWAVVGGRKAPIHFTLADRETFAFAGLWEHWKPEEGEELRTCTLLTVEANDFMRPYHHRMPAILTPEDEAAWLEPAAPTEAVRALLRPYAGPMKAAPVSRAVNAPQNDGPSLLLPLEPEPEGGLFGAQQTAGRQPTADGGQPAPDDPEV